MAAHARDDTPAMRQFHRFKKQHPDCVLFFRMGDFYEMFYDDAELAHRVLGVTLTQRTEGVPMAGVPYHAVENYLRRMIEAGYRVAVCDQVEDPAQAKGVVKRDVTRVITPGTLTDEALLAEGRENPLAAAVVIDEETVAVGWAELSTGAMAATLIDSHEIADELARIAPRELLLAEGDMDLATVSGQNMTQFAPQIGAVLTERPAWHFQPREAEELTKQQFEVATLKGFGFEDGDNLIRPVGAILHYLLETQKSSDGTGRTRIAHLRPPRRFSRQHHMVIDHVSLRSLEIDRTLRTGSIEGSLLGTIQDCVTAMGKRGLRHWLCYPLRDRQLIEQRQRVVESFVADDRFLTELRDVAGQVQDVPRMIARLSVGRALPRDLVGLGRSADQASAIASLLSGRPALKPHLDRLEEAVRHLSELAKTIADACIESPPGHLRDGGLFRDGFDASLDEYRNLQRDSHAWLARYQKELIEQTGIQSLKVAFNKVFGYYIEVTAANRDRAPDHWSRRQTLKNAERFITPQLKEFEGKVLSAEQRAVAREQELFASLCDAASAQTDHLHAFAEVVAALDVLACFARRAVRHRYVRPQIIEEPGLRIQGGRHPVLDELLGDQFVPNDVDLGNETTASLALITGPNMAGKSTYIRQTALIVLLAHTGAFVPADAAQIGLCDRIFTRVGASDELHTGQSTFMVEMTETANICHHATESSLVILDEIGRGTSTLDGLSLAWALAEYLAARRCRTLFATHYHELTALADTQANVCNLNVTVREWHDQIVFLHRIVSGATDRSYGIHVAKIAGVPPPVIERANQLLEQLEVNHRGPGPSQPGAGVTDTEAGPNSAPPDGQMSLFTEYLDHPAVDALQRMDLNHLTPLAAMDELRRLHDMLNDRPNNTTH